MLWLAILIALLLAAAAVAVVVWPLFRPGPAPVMVDDDRLTELLGRKDAVMVAIKDLEFDYRVGKLSEEDYQLYDQRLRRQAVGLLQQIEQLAPESARFDATLEAEIAQRRKVRDPAAAVPVAVAAAAPASAPAIAVTAAAPAMAPAAAANGDPIRPRFCTTCGNRLEEHHKFCANCGAPVSA
jgi:hypothetical protein